MSSLALVTAVIAATAALRLLPTVRRSRSQPGSSAPLVAASLSALVASSLTGPAPTLSLASRLAGLLAAGVVAHRRRSLTHAVAAALAIGWATSLIT
jgi:hypothetical protein